MRNLLLPIAIALCWAAGCTFMAPQRDLTQYFVLSPAPPDPAAAQAGTSSLTIGVGPVRFPDYLKRPWVVTRAASNRLVVSDVNRWAEPLDRNFDATLCQNLSQMLGTSRVVTYPWYADTHVDYQVELWVSHFEASEDGRTQLSALWSINRAGKRVGGGETNVDSAAAPGEDGPSAALSRDLAELSRQIADRIGQLSAAAAANPNSEEGGGRG